jgi:alcohol dehydrogenase class IV
MVNPFQFAKVPRVVFSIGSISKLPDFIGLSGRRLALVTGGSSFLNSVPGGRLLDDLKTGGIECHIVRILGEPSPATIDDAVKALKSFYVEVVAAIGGGSVLDAGKAISAMVIQSESVERYLEGVGDLEHPGTRLPLIAVPTTSGTGSEATKNAVISRTGPDGFKKSLRHDNFVPDIALVDPQLTLNCPPEITAASGMDCFTQLTEAYLSDKAFEYTDALALEGLKAVKSSLRKCFHDGGDIEARAGMSLAALTSGICLANAGLGVVHGFASSVGGFIDIPHGLLCGTLMARVNEVNVRELRKKDGNGKALKKYSQLGKLFLGEGKGSDDFYIDGFLSYLFEISDELGLKILRGTGLNVKDLAEICSRTENKNNPVKLSPDQLQEILVPAFI